MTVATPPEMLVTMGDPAGIGPEIIVKAFAQGGLSQSVVVGDVGVMARTAWQLKQMGLAQVTVQALSELSQWPQLVHSQPQVLPVLQVGETLPEVPLGRVSAVAGNASALAVQWAARAVLRGAAGGLLTAPIHKQAWHAAGVNYPGHTECLQALCAQHLACTLQALPVRMMLLNRRLRVVLVTIHQALRAAIDGLTTELVLTTLRIAHQGLSSQLGRSPRLALAGLNPHAGEGGHMGDEEQRLLAPAVAQAHQEGLDVEGPCSPDTVFLQALDPDQHPGRFDAVVVLYHDQGLIPIKLLGFDEGVNVTLGLPLCRTSPDHGTAFDLAGTGRARPDSLLAAAGYLRQSLGKKPKQ